MNQTNNNDLDLPAGRDKDLPVRGPAKRALHVVVPAHALKQARVAAAESDMKFKHYITRLLENAKPYPFGPAQNQQQV